MFLQRVTEILRRAPDLMFDWFEQQIDPFEPFPLERPPTRLLDFYWYYVRQIWPYFAVVLVTGFLAAMVEIALISFIGLIIDMVRAAKDPASFLADNAWTLAAMGSVALIVRPLVFGLHNLVIEQAVAPSFTVRVRWQTNRYVLRQSLGFFQNDFPGRIANRVMQTGNSLRSSVLQSVDIMWFVVNYAVGALFIFSQLDLILAVPLLVWMALYMVLLRIFVPRIKHRSVEASDSRSNLMGRIVDSYTNVMTLKLFAHAEHEDEHTRAAMKDTVDKIRALTRQVTTLEILVWTLSGLLMVATIGLSVWLWSFGAITVGAIALVGGLVIRLNNMSGWIMNVVTAIFEDIGTVQEGIGTISQPIAVVDKPGAKRLEVTEGAIRFENIRFHYGRQLNVIEDLSLDIAGGEKVGIVGRSGAGKSTLVNLLLRFYDLEGGRILIDGQDISHVTQESLRAKIGMVSQDTSLLHRSVMDNIRYGDPGAEKDDVIRASARAHSHEFILDLVDTKLREGYAAHVGDRGVKLSGGQRQRIAIARVLLKDAPVLVLDEATSALDSEVEAAIQEQLAALMDGKTVIAIAHRLSTIAAMDRLVVLDAGRIVESGSHEQLLRGGGIYAGLWERQSGGFLMTEPA